MVHAGCIGYSTSKIMMRNACRWAMTGRRSEITGQGIMMLMVYAGKKTPAVDGEVAVRLGVNKPQPSKHTSWLRTS